MLAKLAIKETGGADPISRRLAQLHENDKPVLIYSTFPSAVEAERIGGALVDRGFAACVNIFDGMTSIYIWEGKRERGAEAAMLIKTRNVLASQVMAEVKKLHPYTNPALLVLPVSGGSEDFMRWIADQTAEPA
jgi:periplasmic divalent cation tolerance protein